MSKKYSTVRLKQPTKDKLRNLKRQISLDMDEDLTQDDVIHIALLELEQIITKKELSKLYFL